VVLVSSSVKWGIDDLNLDYAILHLYFWIFLVLFVLFNSCSYLFLVDLMKEDSTVILRNAKIDMFKGSMRLAVDKWGRVEVTEPADFTVKEDNNLSLIEYELVNVVEEWLLHGVCYSTGWWPENKKQLKKKQLLLEDIMSKCMWKLVYERGYLQKLILPQLLLHFP